MRGTPARSATGLLAPSGARAPFDPRAILTSIGEVVYDWDLASDAIAWGANASEVLGIRDLAGLSSGAAFALRVEPGSGLTRHEAILQTEQWARAETCRDLIEDKKWLKQLAFEPPADGGDGSSEAEADTVEQSYTVEVSGRRFDVRVIGPPFDGMGAAPNGAAPATAARKPPRRAERQASSSGGVGGVDVLTAPLQGNMWKVLVEAGQQVEEGQLLCIIEAMKMENEITAHKAGIIVELPIQEGAPIQAGAPIATIKSEA